MVQPSQVVGFRSNHPKRQWSSNGPRMRPHDDVLWSDDSRIDSKGVYPWILRCKTGVLFFLQVCLNTCSWTKTWNDSRSGKLNGMCIDVGTKSKRNNNVHMGTLYTVVHSCFSDAGHSWKNTSVGLLYNGRKFSHTPWAMYKFQGCSYSTQWSSDIPSGIISRLRIRPETPPMKCTLRWPNCEYWWKMVDRKPINRCLPQDSRYLSHLSKIPIHSSSTHLYN